MLLTDDWVNTYRIHVQHEAIQQDIPCLAGGRDSCATMVTLCSEAPSTLAQGSAPEAKAWWTAMRAACNTGLVYAEVSDRGVGAVSRVPFGQSHSRALKSTV